MVCLSVVELVKGTKMQGIQRKPISEHNGCRLMGLVHSLWIDCISSVIADTAALGISAPLKASVCSVHVTFLLPYAPH